MIVLLAGSGVQWPWCIVVRSGSPSSVGLEANRAQITKSVEARVISVRYLTVTSWRSYPRGYIIRTSTRSAVATTWEWVGYSIVDVVPKVVLGLLIGAIVVESPRRPLDQTTFGGTFIRGRKDTNRGFVPAHSLFMLGVASAVMVAIGYPSKIRDDRAASWIW